MSNENYKEYLKLRLSIIENGTSGLIEWATASMLGSCIRKLTGLNVNHTSVITVMKLDGDDEKHVYIYEADENGFHPAYLSTRIKQFKGSAYWVPLRDKYKPQRNNIAKQVIKLRGRPYDYKSLFLNAVKRVELDQKELYCSEAVTAALKNAFPLETFRPHMARAGLYKFWDRGDKFFGARPGEFTKIGFHDKSVKIF